MRLTNLGRIVELTTTEHNIMIHENIHVWLGTKQRVMVSNESTKQLQSFNTKDAAINWLFLNGHKEAARQLNREALNNG